MGKDMQLLRTVRTLEQTIADDARERRATSLQRLHLFSSHSSSRRLKSALPTQLLPTQLLPNRLLPNQLLPTILMGHPSGNVTPNLDGVKALLSVRGACALALALPARAPARLALSSGGV